MSLDFDSAALQMQHEEDEYDQEDYAREQELQQLLIDLPHDMLEDSGDQLSDYSAPEEHEQAHEPWDQDAAQWNDRPIATNPSSDYGQDQNMFVDRFAYDQGHAPSKMCASDWPAHHNEAEDKSMFEISGRASENGSEDVYLGDDFKAPSHYPQNGVFTLPSNFRAFTNGPQQDFSNQHGIVTNFVDPPQEPLKYGGSETNSQSLEPYKVVYKPYQKNVQKAAPISSEAEAFEEMQQEFLGTGESSSDNMQILQLQVLNKAKERTLGELNNQLEERAQQIRYLSHQLAIMKDEKDGMYLSLQESQKLYQNSKEREVQLEGQIKAFESQIQTLTANEEQLIKQSKVAEVAMESMQQQLLELRRGDALQRAREQHEAIVAALKQKLEEQTSSLQQKLDVKNASLQEQIEICCHLKEHVKQLERTLEGSKLEKNEIINRLSRSLEESQNQCANLLQTGLVTETNQLRLQLQQAHSAQLLGSEMNKALQEEIKELKEEIVLYESAAKHGVFLNDPGGNLNVELTDSYVDLGIKQINKKTRLQSCSLNKETDKGLSKDEIILELKVEMERILSSNKAKRSRVSRLQNDLEDCHKTIQELKQQLVKSNAKGKNMESPSDSTECRSSEEMLRLKKKNQELQEEIESHNARIQELLEGKEHLKNANQDLCSQMRQMIQDSDRDKQEALDRCERTYRQHYEDTKKKLLEETAGKHAAEKEKLIHAYEENIAQLKLDIDDLNKEMIVVKECYLAVCKEKDEQAALLKSAFEREQQQREEKLLVEKEDSLIRLRNELEETYKNSMELTKDQWQKEKEADIKQRIDSEVELAKNIWEKEQKEAQEQACQEVEKKWQQRLAQALEETKRAAVELKDHGSQTEETLRQLVAEAVEEQTALFREALKAKEKSLREHEANYHESIATQVELALTKARALWLQELTDLEEYKNHLKAAKEKWEKESEISTAEKKSEDLGSDFKDSDDSCMQNGEGEPGDKFIRSMYNVGQQVEIQRMLRKHPSLQETEIDFDCRCKKKNMLSQAEICSEHFRQQLEKKEKECEDLKRKLDKACKHLQLAVKEQKTKSEQAQENEKIMKALLEENSAMKNRLDDLKCVNIPPRSSSEGCISKPCCSCDGKALGEMRSQYLKTVSKIKSDMLRYIHESKERAAEIIKAEVLRERQETARKMRKYYLICLQQLLVDNGKHDGAEKKIICAAGKIATMAKILETPVRNSALNKTPHSVLPQNSKAEEPKTSYIQHSKSTPKENQTHNESAGKRHTPRSLQPQLDAENESRLVSQTQLARKAFKQLDDPSLSAAPAEAFSEEEPGNKGLPCRVGTFQNASSSVSQGKLQSTHPVAVDGFDFGTAGEKYKCLNERPRRTEVGCSQSRQWKVTTSGKIPGFEVQETPVRDEGSSVDWSLLCETLHVNNSSGFQHPVPKIYSRGPLDSHSALPMTNTRSEVKEETSIFSPRLGGHHEKELIKNQNVHCTDGHRTTNSGCTTFADLGTGGAAGAHPNNTVLCPAAGKTYNSLQSRKHIHRVMDCQQDSGFESPQINFD
ncbi:centrosomal protein of 152 kDa [Notechis scutatus]|uniref:Centrosomal protein of 152 kDa n=1 Tax=Notechis scutatus TaxID=8663 RepID=A0A6J1UWR0_9SAUR|nr:centrosomal protein of 152 kDa [Notechis scutatus]